jgi:hypothetical protein
MINQKLSIDLEQVKRFVNTLWPNQESGFLSVSCNGQHGLISKHFQFPLLDTAYDAISRWADRNVWYAIGALGQRPEKGRGTADDVVAVPALVADVDCQGGVHKQLNLPSKDEALACLNAIPFKPSLVLWSGGGFQSYWILKEPWVFDTPEDREQCKNLFSRWQAYIISEGQKHSWKLDNCGSIEHLFRVLGTFNHKAEPVPVEIVQDNGFRYSVDALEEFLDDIGQERSESQSEAGSSTGKGSGRIGEIVERCEFLRHCRDDAASLTEIEWWAMVCALVFEGGSKGAIHALSAGYPRYKTAETDKKILEALKQSGPMTCQAIREKTGFPCPSGGCGVKCPVHLLNGKREKVEEPSRVPILPFPWDVLPVCIAESLKQLSRSCATSPTSLPGAAIAIFASMLGSTVSVSAKKSWTEPLIFWLADIRDTGLGKTAPARLLCRVLYDLQAEADRIYKTEMDEYEALPKKDRGAPPARPRGFFVTSLTLEGLREDHSGHGGKVCVLDELSAFLSGQNEYKSKGSDRESWLCLHDGHPARIVRVGRSVTLSGARISIFGGIQTGVWRKSFAGNGDVFLVDGTVFRFLPTYEGSGFHPLTGESWSEENRAVWESTLMRAKRYADARHGAGESLILILSEDARVAFFRWRNDLVMLSSDLPKVSRGFVPKMVGYALRLAGALYLMECFAEGVEPGRILGLSEMDKGIRLAEFYLGHAIRAVEIISQTEVSEPFEVTEQVVHLAQTLAGLKGDLDNGRLAVGFILERFNEGLKRDFKISNSRLMGSLLRKCGLTITGGRYRANGKTGVYCLIWDQKTDSFIETCPSCPSCPQNSHGSGFQVMEEESPQVHHVHQEDQPMDEMMDMMEEEKPMSINQEPHSERFCGLDGHDGGLFQDGEENPEVILI